LRSGPGSPPRALRDVDTGGLDSSLDEPTDVAASSAEVLLLAFTDGDAALRSLDPGQVPTLWPEHFDIGITVAEVNYGVSPGDTLIDEPYALSALGRCRRAPSGTRASAPPARCPSSRHRRTSRSSSWKAKNVATGNA
jgi:hypothetical protein